MLKFAFSRLIQHLIAQNAWAKPRLAPHASKSIELQLGFLRQHLVILEDGQLAMAGETKAPDATIELTPSMLAGHMLQDSAAKMDVKFSGDQVLAQALAQVLSHLRWDVEDDLSRVIGDIPAQQLSLATQQVLATGKSASQDAVAMLTEYLQEEKPVIAKKLQVEHFNAEVDALRAQLARVEKKFEKLQRRAQSLLQQSSDATSP